LSARWTPRGPQAVASRTVATLGRGRAPAAWLLRVARVAERVADPQRRGAWANGLLLPPPPLWVGPRTGTALASLVGEAGPAAPAPQQAATSGPHQPEARHAQLQQARGRLHPHDARLDNLQRAASQRTVRPLAPAPERHGRRARPGAPSRSRAASSAGAGEPGGRPGATSARRPGAPAPVPDGGADPQGWLGRVARRAWRGLDPADARPTLTVPRADGAGHQRGADGGVARLAEQLTWALAGPSAAAELIARAAGHGHARAAERGRPSRHPGLQRSGPDDGPPTTASSTSSAPADAGSRASATAIGGHGAGAIRSEEVASGSKARPAAAGPEPSRAARHPGQGPAGERWPPGRAAEPATTSRLAPGGPEHRQAGAGLSTTWAGPPLATPPASTTWKGPPPVGTGSGAPADDLDDLAEKFRRVLNEEARRHGVDV
jgi:hypothetical protein